IIALDFERIEIFSTDWLQFFAKICNLQIRNSDLQRPEVLRLAPIQMILLTPQQTFRIDETAIEELRNRYSLSDTDFTIQKYVDDFCYPYQITYRKSDSKSDKISIDRFKSTI
ncbi:MAG: hypothetical protein K2L37_01810, partial [Lactobacillus sp.]|nr:hypothetical protein [Lactobacillus sp.]